MLKLLQETYLGKVKMIYIDPPYNTGNDFVYADDFAQSTDEYLENSGQFDDDGNRLVKNLDSNGRFHTDWLNMIYTRILNMREESQMDSEVNCQREWFKSRGSDVPLWNRQNLSIEETAAYTGIGRDTIYKLIKQDDCNFTLRVGKRTMIKRKRFEEYLEKLYSI